jgi:hypothetical protein
MVVSAIDLPGRSGLELIGELGRRRISIPILYVTRPQGPPLADPRHANVHLMEKPVLLGCCASASSSWWARRCRPRPRSTSPTTCARRMGRHSLGSW